MTRDLSDNNVSTVFTVAGSDMASSTMLLDGAGGAGASFDPFGSIDSGPFIGVPTVFDFPFFLFSIRFFMTRDLSDNNVSTVFTVAGSDMASSTMLLDGAGGAGGAGALFVPFGSVSGAGTTGSGDTTPFGASDSGNSIPSLLKWKTI